MTTLKTITTIELSNVCNLACKYCINRLLVKHPDRTPGFMSDETFERTMFYLEILVRRKTQGIINMNGNGESCLDPKLPERIRRVKDIMGEIRVHICTNGVNMTHELARAMKDAGLDQCDLSLHDPYSARRAVEHLRAVNLPGVVNVGVINMAHNWAGQLEPEHAVEMAYQTLCDPLVEGRGYVLAEGNVTPCCYDYRNLGVFGSVYDDDLLQREIMPYELCQSCHQVIPDELQADITTENRMVYRIQGSEAKIMGRDVR